MDRLSFPEQCLPRCHRVDQFGMDRRFPHSALLPGCQSRYDLQYCQSYRRTARRIRYTISSDVYLYLKRLTKLLFPLRFPASSEEGQVRFGEDLAPRNGDERWAAVRTQGVLRDAREALVVHQVSRWIYR